MQTDIQIGKKKDVYPSKKTLNLYQKEDKTTKASTIALDVLFVLVVVLWMGKILLFDVLSDKNDAMEKVEEAQRYLDNQLHILEDYDAVSEEYIRYSYNILVDELNLHDRMDVLAMLEETVFAQSDIANMSISDNVIAVSFDGLNLNGTAQLIEKIQSYEKVESVSIQNQSGGKDGTYSGDMIITLVPIAEEGTDVVTGGEQ